MIKITFCMLFLLSLNSCITNLHQLVTYDKVITDRRITGTWDKDGQSTFIIEDLLTSSYFTSMNRATVDGKDTRLGFDSRKDSLLYSKSYVIQFVKNSYNYRMIASLMNIGQQLYADLIPVSAEHGTGTTGNMFDGINYMPSHSLAKISFTEGTMKLSFMDGDFIKSKLREGRIALRFEDDQLFNTTVITASSEELQQFVAKYGQETMLYREDQTFILHKR